MKRELVIFDCDGVLVDSEPIINRAHSAVMTACGFPIGDAELLERFLGVADREMIRTLEEEWGRALPADYGDRVAARIRLDYRHSLAATAGIAELIDRLAIPVCVASSGSPDQIRLALSLTGLLDRFGSRIHSAQSVGRGKPAPDLFLYAAGCSGVAPQRTIVVEDSLAGVEAAIAAGMTAIGFCGGGHCRPGHGARLLALGAAVITADAPALAAGLERLGAPMKRAAGETVAYDGISRHTPDRLTSGET